MLIETNEMDRLCLRDYIVGTGWALLSIAGAFISFMFERLPITTIISHSKGFGLGQLAVGIICLISLGCSLYYLYQTKEYQKYLGR